MNILIIEDNEKIAHNIERYLELEGYEIDICNNGLKGSNMAIIKNYDIILLDIMLPKVDGVEVIKKIRKGKETPIIITTAKDTINDKIDLLELGADDYIVKPFDLGELLARIHSVLKRVKKIDSFKVGKYEVNLVKREVTKLNEIIKLTQKEYMILEYLINNSKPVTRTDLIEYLWGTDNIFEGDGKLDVYISNIRKKVGKDIIETLKGFGYKIISK